MPDMHRACEALLQQLDIPVGAEFIPRTVRALKSAPTGARSFVGADIIREDISHETQSRLRGAPTGVAICVGAPRRRDACQAFIQHRLYFFPLPQGQGSLRPILGPSRLTGPSLIIFPSKKYQAPSDFLNSASSWCTQGLPWRL